MYSITDGHGYLVAIRRNAEGARVFMWSAQRRDAMMIHFLQVAETIAAAIPQAVKIVSVT